MRAFLLPAVAIILVSGCMPESRPVYRSGGIGATAAGFRQRGIASFYGPGFHGKLTASGEEFDMYAMTCAHPSLPFDTVLRVVNLENRREVTVRVNDRGPFVAGRIIDLSYAAAERLGMVESGIAEVQLDVLEQGGTDSGRRSL